MSERIHLKWSGPTGVGFDESERAELARIRREIRAALSHRQSGSARTRRQRQLALQNMLNSALITLDLHSAALRYDKRRLHTANIGIAEFLVGSSAQVAEYERESRAAISEHADAVAAEEEAKKREMRAELAPLEAELRARQERAAALEAEAAACSAATAEQQQRVQRYEEYREWMRLNGEYCRLCDEAVELERALQRRKNWGKPESNPGKFF